jgi:hypothetical protein
MAKDELPFDRWVEETGLAAKWEARGEKNGLKKALMFLEEGHTVEELKRMIPPTPNSN